MNQQLRPTWPLSQSPPGAGATTPAPAWNHPGVQRSPGHPGISLEPSRSTLFAGAISLETIQEHNIIIVIIIIIIALGT